jgi:hypothetical protein
MPPLRFEGYVIVSGDGMLANAKNLMPDELKFDGDKRFFSDALDRVALVVHGRNSHEEQPNSPRRKRLILTSKVAALAPDPAHPNALLWNPAGATFEEACARAGVASGTVAVIGGPGVFDMFMDRYDTFWLSVAPKVHLPDGEPCFPGVGPRTPQEILGAHGMKPGEPKVLDPAHGVTVTPWRRN